MVQTLRQIPEVNRDDDGDVFEGHARKDFLGFVTDEASASIIQTSFRSFITQPSDVRRGHLSAAISAFESMASPRFILVDVSGQDSPLELLTMLSNVVEPDVRVLAIGENRDLNFYRELKQSIGVTEYLYKPLTVDLVNRVFLPILMANERASSVLNNALVTISGAGGGAGASTIAVNLAKFLSNHARRNTLLYDPDCYFGTCNVSLNVASSSALKTVFEAPERIDRSVLQSTMQRIDERLSMISCDLDYQIKVDYAPGAVEHTLQLSENRFNFIVADVPMHARGVANEFIKLARHRIIVVRPTMHSVRNAVKLLKFIRASGVASRPIIVLNEVDLPGGLTKAQIAEALQREPDVTLPYVPSQANKCCNLGDLLADHSEAYKSGIIEIAAQLDTKVLAERSKMTRLSHKLSALLSRFAR
ncbi:hypothetical protein CGLAMM_05645 [Acetobacteraceae bacterium EV16G]|uniref:Pilus assembly protein CpaE n=2 Tax=Sorlinia euscelidii TaxID=3081148 RepID=A0ABU7U0V2_9PROT